MMIHRFVNRPIALRDEAAAELLQRLQTRLEPEALEAQFRSAYSDSDDDDLFTVVRGVAIIPVSGVLVNGPTYFWDESDYSSITESVAAAANSDQVKAIALHIASPGGEVAGLFDLADMVYSVRDKKTTWAVLDDHAYSAAYAIASAADRIIIPRTGGAGSIGVVAMHMDMSKMLEQFGVTATLVQYGARKTDYSPLKPLSEDAKDRLQADVNTIGEMFIDSVARNRGLSKSRVRGTEAGIFMGQAAVDAGLADEIMSPSAAFAKLIDKVN